MEQIKALLQGDNLKKFLKFALTGVGNTLVDLILFRVLYTYLGVNIYLSQVCSYSAGMLNSYVVNRSWTFRSKEKFFSAQMVRFLALGGLMLALSTGLLYLFTGWGLSGMAAKLLTTGLVLVVNFLLSKLWVFRSGK
ncbi:GtrA family protein [Merdimmobilis hominis]|jgi:putative flippase GtrA|uniref:GtrA-like protein n=1 Tax=uncultured Anaerotruncus sp. TaxID=905011 RepID=A0A6N2SMN4_9FIRM|nr:GtrA family protein [Merdimmobilis hominis]MCD4836172.1 GtrA family protein [Merdimmobilis hominis]